MPPKVLPEDLGVASSIQIPSPCSLAAGPVTNWIYPDLQRVVNGLRDPGIAPAIMKYSKPCISSFLDWLAWMGRPVCSSHKNSHNYNGSNYDGSRGASRQAEMDLLPIAATHGCMSPKRAIVQGASLVFGWDSLSSPLLEAFCCSQHCIKHIENCRLQ